MTDTNSKPPGRVGRSILAVFAGFLVGAGFALGTDEILHLAKVYPPWGARMSDPLFGLALAYRIVYSVAAGYVTARVAPGNPMKLAMIGGTIGFVLSVLGAVATWNRDIGPHWYSIAVALIALPCAWIGAQIYLSQREPRSAARRSA
jgi:hypothetical protein